MTVGWEVSEELRLRGGAGVSRTRLPLQDGQFLCNLTREAWLLLGTTLLLALRIVGLGWPLLGSF